MLVAASGWALLATGLLAWGCHTAVDTAPPAASAPTRRAAPAPVDGAPAPVVAAAPDAGTGLITDEACLAKGGQIVTEKTYANVERRRPDVPVTPFRVCRVPSSANGKSCRGESDCDRGRCFCSGPLGRPDPENDPALVKLDRTPATGICSDGPIPSGSWFCLVEGGLVHLDGIIVD